MYRSGETFTGPPGAGLACIASLRVPLQNAEYALQTEVYRGKGFETNAGIVAERDAFSGASQSKQRPPAIKPVTQAGAGALKDSPTGGVYCEQRADTLGQLRIAS